MMYYNYNDWVFSPFHILFSLIGWILVIMLVLWVIRRLMRYDRRRHHMMSRGLFRDPGLDVLRERFAKGEITKEEYEEKKKVLMSE